MFYMDPFMSQLPIVIMKLIALTWYSFATMLHRSDNSLTSKVYIDISNIL